MVDDLEPYLTVFFLDIFTPFCSPSKMLWNHIKITLNDHQLNRCENWLSVIVRVHIYVLVIDYLHRPENSTNRRYKTQSTRKHFRPPYVRVLHGSNQISWGGRFRVLMTPLLYPVRVFRLNKYYPFWNILRYQWIWMSRTKRMWTREKKCVRRCLFSWWNKKYCKWRFSVFSKYMCNFMIPYVSLK